MDHIDIVSEYDAIFIFCLKYEDQFKKNTRGGEKRENPYYRAERRVSAMDASLAFRINDRGGCTRAMYVIDQENKYKMHCAAMNFSETHVAVGSSSSSKEDASVHLLDLSYEDGPIQSITLSNAREARVFTLLGCYGGQSGVMARYVVTKSHKRISLVSRRNSTL